MTRDASLDEFLGGGDEDDVDAADAEAAPEEAADTTGDGDEVGAEDTTAGGGGGPDASDAVPEDDASDESEWLHAAEPARSTYDWSPDGAACAACGATVAARWRDEPGLVCADCKEW